MATAQALLTAEEYGHLPDPGFPTELFRGRIVKMTVPGPRHGQVCCKVARLVGNFVEEHDLGHVVSNDSGILTERDPDTVRGADVAFYSYARYPKGPLPKNYTPAVPELVFEVRSPSDRWAKVVKKVGEYLDAGVLVVCVLDPDARSAHLYPADRPVQVLSEDQEWSLPEILGAFRVPVGQFFE
ncbi:Uma2 family endonuclease [soil metagenome]